MPNIDDMINNVVKLDGTFITVHHERCVLVRNRNADCLKCSTVCTTGCITFDGESLNIDTTRCIGCGTCATICPTCCLEAHNPNDSELLAQCEAVAQAHDGRVCIACDNILDKEVAAIGPCTDVARVTCLGRIEETLLVDLAQKNYETILVHGHCRLCEHVKGRQMLERVLDTKNKLLDAWGVQAKCTLPKEMPWEVNKNAASTDEQTAAQQANIQATHAEKPKPHYSKVMEDGTLPHFLPDRRERLLDSLASFGQPRDVILETRLWGHVIIDTEKCKSCRMCSVFCPTGALSRFDEEDGTFGVKHYAGDCIKCRACTEICPANALTLSDEVNARDMLGGMTDKYVMKPLEVERSGPHTIRDMARTFTGGTQVYER